MKRKYFALLVLILLTTFATAQKLKPGFNKAEYIEMLRITSRHFDTAASILKIPGPKDFRKAYRSPVMGLDNRWDLWTNGDGVGVISIRGTTANPKGWLENFMRRGSGSGQDLGWPVIMNSAMHSAKTQKPLCTSAGSWARPSWPGTSFQRSTLL